MKKLSGQWSVFCLILATLWLRVANLGYSDYQGDEIEALVQPVIGQSWLYVIFQQRKGPTQFLITHLIHLIHPSFRNEFFTRLSFALAGALAVFIFYEMLKLHTGKKIALYAAFFLSVNGLFVGLTRIVQYQAFVLLFSCLALYAFSLSLYNHHWKIAGIYIGFLFWTLALLTHFDGVLTAPFVAYLLIRWVKNHSEFSIANRLKHIGLPGALGFLLLAGFYIPLLAASSGDTQAYWLGRVTGGDGEIGLLPSSIANFNLYNPVFVLPVYIVLGFLSLFDIKRAIPFWFWFLFPWILMEILIFDPGTHIYTYLLPASVIAVFGLDTIERALVKISGQLLGRATGLILPAILIILLFSLSHFIFIDHTPEYPWEARRFLFWKIERPGEEYKLWVFGFPYHRHWEEIGDFAAGTPESSSYLTNENKSIAEYYIPRSFNMANADVYIHIFNTQSFRDRLANEKIRYWIKNYPPEKSFRNGDKVVAEIYKMPSGSLKEIRATGY